MTVYEAYILLQEEIKAGPYGSPLVAETVEDMTDENRVYVYTGEEAGYAAGNWYYWDGSAWTSGGVYNAVAVETDTTLTESGVAADAKKTGDEIDGLKSELTEAESTTFPLMSDWKNTNSASASYGNYSATVPIYARKGDILTIESTLYNSGVRLTLYNADGTNITEIAMRTSIHYRVQKDITSFRFYNGGISGTDVTITIKKESDVLPITNFYDKSAKESGFINGSSIASGYYHSDYIPCAVGDKLIYSGYNSTFGNTALYFYDDEKTYLGKAYNGTLRDDGLYEFTPDVFSTGLSAQKNNIYYVRFNMTTGGSDTAVFYINEIPDTSLAFGQDQPDSGLFFNKQQKEYLTSISASPISGKKIAYNGDSIAESRLTAGNAYNGGGYAKMIADLTGGTYVNRAMGGGILASAPGDGGSTPNRCVVSDVTNMTDDADLICFEGGINDYWREVPLGDYSESDYTSTVDTTTICGALESIFRQATQKWIGKPICFIIVHKITNTVYSANTAGYTFAQAREKMIGICNKYAIPYYDAFAESGLNAYNSVQNTNFLTSNSTGEPDGCHPNENGYKKYYVPQLIALFNKIMPRS